MKRARQDGVKPHFLKSHEEHQCVVTGPVTEHFLCPGSQLKVLRLVKGSTGTTWKQGRSVQTWYRVNGGVHNITGGREHTWKDVGTVRRALLSLQGRSRQGDTLWGELRTVMEG